MNRGALAALLVAATALLGAAAAHATLVFGELTLTPDPATAGAPLSVTVTLEDPSLTPLEDAIVTLEFRTLDAGAAPLPTDGTYPPALRTVRLVEEESAVYTADLDLPTAGSYQVRVRDNTYQYEEANASVVLALDGRPLGVLPFVLPPTQVGPRSLTTWLVWLIGLPLVAGAVVTVLVLTSNRSKGGSGADEAAGT
ncbi:MAG: hypothetical protein P1P87_08715 [Trueperaceae bacterium]|nr:hypothetical protein [Trueperaceae bacterium]